MRDPDLKETMDSQTKNAPVIAVGNQKGGVGKTTVTVHVAAALGRAGRSCLIIDLDPAAGATKHLGVPQNSFAGTLELFTTDENVESLAVTERMPEGVHLIPARTQLSEIDNVVSKYVDRTRILERPLAEARAKYDYVFLDTAPTAAFTTTVAAYSAADWFLLTAFPHPLSMGGLTEAFRDIADARKHRNPQLEVLGIVFANVDRRTHRLRANLEAVVSQSLPGRKFATSISQSIVIPDLSGSGITIFQEPKLHNHHVAREFSQLAAEIEHRVRHREQFLSGQLPPLDSTDFESGRLVGNA
jgi:chromosome partitioning protein